MFGIIYLIQPCELVKTNRYKIGISFINDLKRCNSYKKGTRYLSIMEVKNPLILENNIKIEFNKVFKCIAGKEWFEGEEKKMIELFIELYLNHINSDKTVFLKENNEYKCNLCGKLFVYISKLNEHLNKKTPCNKETKELNCDLCNVSFISIFHKKRHEKTSKHTKKENKKSNINNIINDIAIDININEMNIFSNTDIATINLDNLTKILTNGILQRQINILKNKYNNMDHNIESVQYNYIFLMHLIEIFKELNFNKNSPQNNNCKALVFYNTSNKIFTIKYLVLNKDLNNIFYWNELTYNNFVNKNKPNYLIELLNIITLVKDRFNLENLNYMVDYLNEYFINNEFLQNEIKEDIEEELRTLSKLYNSSLNNFNFKNEAKDYIKKETILPNGEQPQINFLSEN